MFQSSMEKIVIPKRSTIILAGDLGMFKTITSSGPNRPAAAIGGGIFWDLISTILLVVRRLRTSGCNSL